jgi:hypothetical protein
MADNWSNFHEKVNREFHTLLPSLPDDDATSPSTVKGDRFRLTRRPIQGLASEQLSFRECDIFSDALGQAEVVRAMNILIYFDQSTQQILLRRLGDAVMEAGMLLVGTNGGNGCEERYTCYRREPKMLVPEYFSFSLDNLRPLGVMPWFTLHEDDLEARRLARYASLLRSDLSFWREFSAFFDDELARRKMMVRDEAGNLRSPNGSAFIDGYHAKMAGIRAALEKEFTSKAIDALQRQGVEAFRNEAGHLAVPAYVADGLKPLVITD